jgi:TolB-like protein
LVALTPGTVVGGKFKVERLLGEGGMGAVYVAVQEPLERRVALKLVKLDRGGHDEALARFRREAKVVAALRCPHVVVLFDYGEHDGGAFFAMELLEGESLRARIASGPLDVDTALVLARDVACALRTAHEAAVIHRDVKPENIVLQRDRPSALRPALSAKLVDFGIAGLGAAGLASPTVDVSAKAEPAESLATGLTAEGSVVGTPGYVAPELLLGSAAGDARSDLYALGVVLFEALAGVPPFSNRTPMALLLAHAQKPPPDLREKAPAVPAAVAALVGRLLEKDPAKRPQTAEALIDEIDSLRGSSRPTESIDVFDLPAAPLLGERIAPPADRPAIAVQPFATVGVAAEDDAIFAESLSEDILFELGRFKQLFVVAQTTMWQVAGRDTDALRVGRALRVRYVLSGTLRRAGDDMRVCTRLIDVQTGAQAWAGRFDRPRQDVFAVEAEVARGIVASVAGHIEKSLADSVKQKPQQALAAYELLARGRALHHRRTLSDNGEAIVAIERAIEVAPEYAQAHAWLACVVGQRIGLTGDMSTLGKALATVDRALALDDGDAECHRLACEMNMGRDWVKVRHHHERAYGLNPNDARIVGQRGELAFYDGKLDEARAWLEEAMRLDPLGPKSYARVLAAVHYLRRDLDVAARVMAAAGEDRPWNLGLAAAIAAMRGDMEGAASRVSRLREMSPKFDPLFMVKLAGDEHKALWLEGYRKAGIEC